LDRSERPPESRAHNWITASCDDEAFLRDGLADCDSVVHLAWVGSAPFSGTGSQFSNLQVAARLAASAAAAGVGHLLFASSGGTVYGRVDQLPIGEATPLAPISAYGAEKVAAEAYLHVIAHGYGLKVTVLRVANLYGPGQQPGRGQGVIATALHRALTGVPLEVWGDGSTIRDYVYIDDVAEAFMAVLDQPKPFQILNIGTGIGTSLTSLIQVMEQVLERRIAVTRLPARPVDVPANQLDISRIAREYGWRPKIRLREGLFETVRWMSGSEVWTPANSEGD
jgi:UDP-glucose 4-epimerase